MYARKAGTALFRKLIYPICRSINIQGIEASEHHGILNYGNDGSWLSIQEPLQQSDCRIIETIIEWQKEVKCLKVSKL